MAATSGPVCPVSFPQQTGEILSLQYLPAPDYDGNLLIVLYASKEQGQSSDPGSARPV